MGLGSRKNTDTSAAAEALAKQVAKTQANATDTDATSPMAMAARQRESFKMAARSGFLSTLLTSSRGTEGVAGAGLKGPPRPGDGAPLITLGDPIKTAPSPAIPDPSAIPIHNGDEGSGTSTRADPSGSKGGTESNGTGHNSGGGQRKNPGVWEDTGDDDELPVKRTNKRANAAKGSIIGSIQSDRRARRDAELM